mgnify:CR=1 FL=1
MKLSLKARLTAFLPSLVLLCYIFSAFIENWTDESFTVIPKNYEAITIIKRGPLACERDFWVDIGKIDNDCGLISSLSTGDENMKLVRKNSETDCTSVIEKYTIKK